MQALVVSKETVSGGEAINAGRRQRRDSGLWRCWWSGWSGVAAAEEGRRRKGQEEEEAEGKISSTDLRAAEAAKKK